MISLKFGQKKAFLQGEDINDSTSFDKKDLHLEDNQLLRLKFAQSKTKSKSMQDSSQKNLSTNTHIPIKEETTELTKYNQNYPFDPIELSTDAKLLSQHKKNRKVRTSALRLPIDNPNSVLAKFRKDLKEVSSYIDDQISKLKDTGKKFEKPMSLKFKNKINITTPKRIISPEEQNISQNKKISHRACFSNDTLNNYFIPQQVKDDNKLLITQNNQRRFSSMYNNSSNTNKAKSSFQNFPDISIIQNSMTTIPSVSKSVNTHLKSKETGEKGYSRLQRFEVHPIKNWKKKVGFNYNTSSLFSKHILNTLEFQSSSVLNEISVVLDSIQYYKVHYLSGTELANAFKNSDFRSQIKYNQLLEETCGLLMEIPQIILLSFYEELDKFMISSYPKKENLHPCEVTNEEECLRGNAKLISDISVFITSCHEIYATLVKQACNMLIPLPNYTKLMGYLERARYNVSSLIIMSKAAFKKLSNDQNLVGRFQISVENLKNEKKKMEEKEKDQNQDLDLNLDYLRHCNLSDHRTNNEDLHQQYTSDSMIKNEKIVDTIRKKFKVQLNEEHLRINRLNNLLNIKKSGFNESFEKKKKILRDSHFSLKSVIVSNNFL